MIRVYDTNALWRHEEIIRIRHQEAEIAELRRILRDRSRRPLPPMNALRN